MNKNFNFIVTDSPIDYSNHHVSLSFHNSLERKNQLYSFRSNVELPNGNNLFYELKINKQNLLVNLDRALTFILSKRKKLVVIDVILDIKDSISLSELYNISKLAVKFQNEFLFHFFSSQVQKDKMSKQIEYIEYLEEVKNKATDTEVFKENLHDLSLLMDEEAKTIVDNIYTDRDNFVIVDAHNLYNRYYYGFNTSFNSKNQPINLLQSVVYFLYKLMRDPNIKYLAFASEKSNSSNYRKTLYANYKSNRGPKPEDLIWQLEIVDKMVSSLGVPVIQVDDYEADDVIASLVKAGIAKNKNVNFRIYSSDKDLGQLINDKNHVDIFNFQKDMILNEETFEKEYSIHPSKFLDFLSFMGDSSDNVPGVAGIGKVRALELLQKYGSADEVFLNLSHLSNSMKKKLNSGKEAFYLSKKLINLVDNLEYVSNLDLSTFLKKGDFNENGLKMLDELELVLPTKKYKKIF